MIVERGGLPAEVVSVDYHGLSPGSRSVLAIEVPLESDETHDNLPESPFSVIGAYAVDALYF